MSIIFSLPFGMQRFGVVIEQLLFSSIIIKMEFVASKEFTANSHFRSSQSFLLMEKKNFSFVCLV